MADSSTATIDFRDSPEYKGHMVLALNASLIAVTSLIVFMRLYVRLVMSKTFGLDDVIAFLGFVWPLDLTLRETLADRT